MNVESFYLSKIYDSLSLRAAKLLIGLFLVVDRETITQEEKTTLQEWVDEEREYYNEINGRMRNLVNFNDVIVTDELLTAVESLSDFISENVRMISIIKNIPVVISTSTESDIKITTEA